MSADSAATRNAAVPGALYALLLIAALLVRAEPFAAEPVPAGRLLELVAPGVLDPGPADANLLARLLLGPPADDTPTARSDASEQPRRGRLFVGILPLLLALLGVFWATGRSASVLRAALLVAGALAATGLVRNPWLPLAVPLLLVPLAGLGLSALLRGDDSTRGAGVPLAVGTLSVLLAGVLGAAAAAAGARTEQDLMAPLTTRLAARGYLPPTPGQIHHTATQLLARLDESALAAMLAMLALLLLLKTRRMPVVLLVLVVSLADVFREPIASFLRGDG